LLRIGDVGGRDVLDALDQHVVEVGRVAEGEARQQRQLVRGVAAADVERRIGLGITQRLRLRQHLGEGALGLLHVGEDEVAGAVQYSAYGVYAVGNQALAQRLDDGDAARRRRLELERQAFLLGKAR